MSSIISLIGSGRRRDVVEVAAMASKILELSDFGSHRIALSCLRAWKVSLVIGGCVDVDGDDCDDCDTRALDDDDDDGWGTTGVGGSTGFDDDDNDDD